MTTYQDHPDWLALDPETRAEIMRVVDAIKLDWAARPRPRNYNDCMSSCAQMSQNMHEHLQQMGGAQFGPGAGLYVEEVMQECYRACHEANNVPHDYR